MQLAAQWIGVPGLIICALCACDERSSEPAGDSKTGDGDTDTLDSRAGTETDSKSSDRTGGSDTSQDTDFQTAEGDDIDTVTDSLVEEEPPQAPDDLGTYQVVQYDADFNGHKGTIRFPANGKVGERFPGIAMSAGYIATKDDIIWICEHITSHGYITLCLTPSANAALASDSWAKAIQAGIEKLKQENKTATSPIHTLLDTDRLGVIGHSMGGIGALLAASRNTEIKAVVALAPAVPFLGVAVNLSVPVQFQTSTNDGTIPSQAVINYFSSRLNTASDKQLLVIKGAGHNGYKDVGTTPSDGVQWVHPITSRYFTAWFQYYLKGLEDPYRPYLYGEEAEKDLSSRTITRNEHNQ